MGTSRPIVIALSVLLASGLLFATPPAKDRPDVTALVEANRLQSISIETLMHANDALRQSLPDVDSRTAIDDTKAAAERSARESKTNREFLESARKELMAQIRAANTTQIWWNVAIWITLLSVAKGVVFYDRNRVNKRQAAELAAAVRILLAAIERGAISNLTESQKATTDRHNLSAKLDEGIASNRDQLVLDRSEVEKTIDKIEVTTDATHTTTDESHRILTKMNNPSER